MKRLIGVAVALVAAGVIMSPPVAHAADIVIPINTVIRAGQGYGPGDEILLQTVSTGAYEGRTCSVRAVGQNQTSVHRDNNLIVASGGYSSILYDVERSPGAITEGPPITLGPVVTVTLQMGPRADGWFSAGINVELTCEAPPPPTPAASATGACVENAFVVTVTNTGEVTVSGDVETYGSFSLEAGQSASFDIPDKAPGDTVTVTYDQEIPADTVTVLDCENPPPPPPPPPPEEPVIGALAFAPVCQADTPYIDYEIEVSGTDATTATLTFFDLDGNQVDQFTNMPFSGRVLWPGASVDPPDWPGWRLNADGFWEPDPSDARLRDGLTILVEVNPSATAPVRYPPATEACNTPPPPPGTPPTTQPPAPPSPQPGLPVTGRRTTYGSIAGGFLLALGAALVLVARRPTPA